MLHPSTFAYIPNTPNMASFKIEEESIPDLTGKVALITGMLCGLLHTCARASY